MISLPHKRVCVRAGEMLCVSNNITVDWATKLNFGITVVLTRPWRKNNNNTKTNTECLSSPGKDEEWLLLKDVRRCYRNSGKSSTWGGKTTELVNLF